jgi:exopolysaccharide biosynthesis polyprenyl glycosylphosphotransferase
MINKRVQAFKYILLDYISAVLVWVCFFAYRKIYVEPLKFGYSIPLDLDKNFYLAIIFIPIYWMTLYYLTGTYKNVYKKSRLKEMVQTFSQTFLGVLVIFFVLILDDQVAGYTDYYLSFLTLVTLQFFLTYIPRFIITTRTKFLVKQRIIGFNTLLVGSNDKAYKLYKEIEDAKESVGYKFLGFVNGTINHQNDLAKHLKQLGTYAEIAAVVRKYQIDEVIIAIESREHDHLKAIIDELENSQADVKIIPDMYDIITGSVKMNHLFGIPLIQIKTDLMPTWQMNLKRFIDVVVSLFFLIVLSPLYLITAIIVKSGSNGPILFRQDRIGMHGKAFKIIKFRSMYLDAESKGPQLAKENDQRITNFGKFMRRTRLDEIPQFYNVLLGEMSLVGPRPERKFYIDQIMAHAPHYKHLQKVRPGITSWGQVKYGYAENVEQMLARLKYDIIYIENMSIAVDFKILFFTIATVLQGRGK